jgi:hypothetical protein
MDMDEIISEFKGFNGRMELYNDKIIISHHKKQQIEILFSQIERMQFKRGGMEQGFIQLTIIGEEKFYNNLKDITNDDGSITFGYPKNDEAEQFKYQLAKLMPDKPINILQKIKDIQKFNPKPQNENIVESKPITLKEKRAQFQPRAREANPKAFGNFMTADEKTQHKKDFAKRKAELDKQDIIYCPKCLSTQLSTNQKGFSAGNAIAGGLLLGPLGLIAGTAGSKRVRITCLKCGHKFYPGKK